MATRIVLWLDTTVRMAPKVMNGGVSIPSNVEHKPNDTANLEHWFVGGWRIVSASSHAPIQGSISPAVLEVTTLVLEHN